MDSSNVLMWLRLYYQICRIYVIVHPRSPWSNCPLIRRHCEVDYQMPIIVISAVLLFFINKNDILCLIIWPLFSNSTQTRLMVFDLKRQSNPDSPRWNQAQTKDGFRPSTLEWGHALVPLWCRKTGICYASCYFYWVISEYQNLRSSLCHHQDIDIRQNINAFYHTAGLLRRITKWPCRLEREACFACVLV